MRMRVYIDKDGELFSCAPIGQRDTGSQTDGELKMSLTDPTHIESEDAEGMFLDGEHQYVSEIAVYDIEVPPWPAYNSCNGKA